MEVNNMAANYGEKLIKLGLNIAYYRKLKLLSQEELAEKINISRPYMSKIEAPNMYASFSLKLLCKIADALEVSESKLFDFRD